MEKLIKKLSVSMILITLVFTVGCGVQDTENTTQTQTETQTEDVSGNNSTAEDDSTQLLNSFKIVEEKTISNGHISIIVDADTMVEYLYTIQYGYYTSTSTFVQLTNLDGTPKLYNGDFSGAKTIYTL